MIFGDNSSTSTSTISSRDENSEWDHQVQELKPLLLHFFNSHDSEVKQDSSIASVQELNNHKTNKSLLKSSLQDTLQVKKDMYHLVDQYANIASNQSEMHTQIPRISKSQPQIDHEIESHQNSSQPQVALEQLHVNTNLSQQLGFNLSEIHPKSKNSLENHVKNDNAKSDTLPRIESKKSSIRFSPFIERWSNSPMGSTNSGDSYVNILPESPIDIVSMTQVIKDTIDTHVFQVLQSFVHSLVSQSSIQIGVKELNSIEHANIILHFISQTVPTELYVFENHLQRSMNVEETLQKLDITKKVSSFLHLQIQNCEDHHLQKNVRDRDTLWDCHFRALIRCTMMSSMDLQRFCSPNDIQRRQEVIHSLGFSQLWKVIKMRSTRDRELIKNDNLLFSALSLLLRMTISTTNLESTQEYSNDYYNIGQNGVDGAIQFTSFIEANEDKRKFWKIIDILLDCSSTRIVTLLILFNIALFRKSISSLIGNISLFSWLCSIVSDESREPINAAQKNMLRIISKIIPRNELQMITIGCPIYIISRGISSCGQESYNKIFEKLVWDDKFLKRILEYGEGNNLHYAGHIARVLYSVAFRSSLKKKENRIRFATLLIDSYEGFSNIVGHIVNQDTEVKIIALLQLLATPGYCEARYHRIFVDLYRKTLKQMENRQKELESLQYAKNHANELVSKGRVEYFCNLKEKSFQRLNLLSNEIDTIQKELNQRNEEYIQSTRRIYLYHVGIFIPLVLGSYLSIKAFFNQKS